MLDRKQYEEQLQKAREEQIGHIAGYLTEYIKLNAHIRDIDFAAVSREEDLEHLRKLPMPRSGRDPEEVAQELIDRVFSKSLSIQHPRFFSFVTAAVSPYSLAGAVLSDIYNLNAAGYELSPGAATIEENLIRWMGSLAGFDDRCGGLFTSGGSLSNLTGCVAARDNILTEAERPIGVAYVSDQTHSSVKKGLRIMGLRQDQIRIIPTDELFRLRTDLLEAAIQDDIAAGLRPFLIVGTIATTNTGSIDPLDELAGLRDRYSMWLHVDGAFGGSILFSDIYRNLAKGIELADSLSWDLHKWALQTYSCSALIARDKRTLVNTFVEHPEYLADLIDAEHTDGWDLGIEMSRPARAIKLWFTVQAMGTDLLSDVIDYSFYNAKQAERRLRALEGWQITSPAMCGTVTFRYAPTDVDPAHYDELNAAISKTIIDERFAYIVTTVVKGMRVLRLNLINGNTTTEDVEQTVAELDRIAGTLCPQYK